MDPNNLRLLLLILNILYHSAGALTENSMDNNKTCRFDFNLDQTSTYMWITIVLMFLSIFRMSYNYFETVAEYVPESCLLIVIGFIFGLILQYMRVSIVHDHILKPDIFFFLLLPPIILNSSYSLYNRTFGDNLGIVLTFAVFGTILNFLIIGSALWPLHYINLFTSMPNHYDLNLKTFFLFSSLIVAVDPVAVLAIFQEIGVNERLYYMVFGESLLNDAVTVVLYNIVKELYPLQTTTVWNIINGIFSFFTISLGGLIVGVLVGIWCCWLVRFTGACRMIEPAVILITGYISYILGDLFGWSGIIAMIGCGLLQITYAFDNMSQKSVTMVQELINIISWNSEAIIFLLLGMEVTGYKTWTGFSFVASCLFLCLLSRTIVVLFICWFIQVKDGKFSKIKFTEQFVIIYGGMRGGISFTLAVLLQDVVKNHYLHRLLLDTTIVVVLFTVFIMGISMKPLVSLLKIKIEYPEKISLLKEMNNFTMDNVLLGIEYISGEKGMFVLRNILSQLDKKYIQNILLKNPGQGQDKKFFDIYKNISLALHKANINPDKKDIYLKDMQCPYTILPASIKYMPETRSSSVFRPSMTERKPGLFHTKSFSRSSVSHIKSFAINRSHSVNQFPAVLFENRSRNESRMDNLNQMHKLLRTSLLASEYDTKEHLNPFRERLSVMIQKKSIISGAADKILDDLISSESEEREESSPSKTTTTL